MAIVSKSKKWCFIHIQRTGGTTIRYVIDKSINDFDVVGSEHGTITECINLLPKVIDEYYKFSYVRQPYDWIVSLFYYIKMQSSNHPDSKRIEKFNLYEFLQWFEDVGMKRSHDCGLPVYKTQSQHLFFNDNFMMDYVFKFEELCDDNGLSNLRSIFESYGIIQPNSIPVLNKSDRPFNSMDMFSIKEIKLVNKIFADDFMNFKYFKYE